jgi:uncharacterized SAM-binding protein YcdF (DUF218 family)
MSQFSSSFSVKKQSFYRRHSQALWSMLATGLILLTVFFIVFANSLSQPPKDVPQADGIVIFTGTATARIRAGIGLLAREKGERLLVSGVYENQGFDTISALMPENRAMVECCVDLDYVAGNTLTNAQQTALWAEVHGYQSLILVTSAHHVPRAFLELRRTMPTVRLSAWPVVPKNVHIDRWWAYSGTTSLLIGEYMRYLWALSGLPRDF